MKKLLILTLIAGSLAIGAPVADAKAKSGIAPELTVAVNAEQPGRRWRRGGRWNRRPYTVVRTRIVWRWGRRYRETYRITYLPNGRTRTTIIRRVRVRSW